MPFRTAALAVRARELGLERGHARLQRRELRGELRRARDERVHRRAAALRGVGLEEHAARALHRYITTVEHARGGSRARAPSGPRSGANPSQNSPTNHRFWSSRRPDEAVLDSLLELGRVGAAVERRSSGG